MARRGHTQKSPSEQKTYVRLLPKLGYEPTAEEELEFPESDKLDEGSDTIRSARTRKPKGIGRLISKHFGRNKAVYITLIITIVVLGAYPFLMDIKSSIARIEATIEGIKKDIGRNETKIQNIEDKVHNQDLKIQEQGIKINNLEKESEKTEATSK